MTPNSEDIKAQADNEAKVTNRFIRIIQRKDLPWERDSIARAAHDPEHIPDCNVKATVGQHFLFHEPIPKAINGQLSTCSENGYQWTVNSTTWNHLRVQWQEQQEEAAKQQAAEEAKAKAEAEAKRMRRRRQSNSPLRKPSERGRRNVSGRSL